MSLYRYYYDSLGAMLEAIEASPRDPDGTYRLLHPGNSTHVDDSSFYGRPLVQMIADCRAMTPFTNAIEHVEALAARLTATLPPLRTVQRRRRRGSEGDSLDINRVLAGDLAHAWLDTRRLLHDDPTALTTIILLTSYTSATGGSAIFWSMAATLALACLCEQSGRRVCLAAVDYTAYLETPNFSSHTVILKAHDAPWSLQEAVVTTDMAFLRRLTFRLQEMLPFRIDSSYGRVPDAPAMRHHMSACAQEYGWRHWLMGAHPNHDDVTSEARALDWLRNEMTALEGVAV